MRNGTGDPSIPLFLPYGRAMPLVFAFAPARVCPVLPSAWPPFGSVKLLLLRPVGIRGAGVLVVPETRAGGGARPTAHHALCLDVSVDVYCIIGCRTQDVRAA